MADSTIGLYFKTHRELAGYSLQEVASTLTNVTTSELEQFEIDAGLIPLSDLFHLANFLNVDPEKVISLVDKFATESIDLGALVNGLGKIVEAK